MRSEYIAPSSYLAQNGAASGNQRGYAGSTQRVGEPPASERTDVPVTIPSQLTAQWTVPNVRLSVKGIQTTLHEALSEKRGLLFGFPGAFAPFCTNSHMPGIRDNLSIFKKAVDFVACVAVNDPYVLKAWARELKVPSEIVMIADWEAKFAKALGFELDASVYHMGIRSRRFAVLVDRGAVLWFGLEEDSFADKVAIVLRHLRWISDSDLAQVEEVCKKYEPQVKASLTSPMEEKRTDGGKTVSEEFAVNPNRSRVKEGHNGNTTKNFSDSANIRDSVAAAKANSRVENPGAVASPTYTPQIAQGGIVVTESAAAAVEKYYQEQQRSNQLVGAQSSGVAGEEESVSASEFSDEDSGAEDEDYEDSVPEDEEEEDEEDDEDEDDEEDEEDEEEEDEDENDDDDEENDDDDDDEENEDDNHGEEDEEGVSEEDELQ